jgi:hypothetical protein
MPRLTKQRWMMWAGVVFAAQLALFAIIQFVLIGAPYWAELPYLPFQTVFCNLLGQYWPIGLWLGVIIGTLFYSCAGGALLAWIFRNRNRV